MLISYLVIGMTENIFVSNTVWFLCAYVNAWNFKCKEKICLKS